MVDEKAVRLGAHRNNIHRYQRLLTTQLTELERQYLEQRMTEEQSNVDMLLASSFETRANHQLSVAAGD